MIRDADQFKEVIGLMEALCEDRISRDQAERLEQIVLHDQDARQVYLSYLDLHGTLYWDTAIGAEHDAGLVTLADMSTPALKRRSNTTAILASACVALLAVGFIWAWAYLSPNNQANSAANAKSYGTPVSNNDQDSDRSINDLTAQSGQPVGNQVSHARS